MLTEAIVENKKCFECSGDADCEHHVVPMSRGGTRTVFLCGNCHGKAHHRESNMDTSQLTRDALQHKRRMGTRAGQLPYGFDLAADGDTLIPNSREQAAVELMGLLREDGLSYHKIAAILQRKHVATKEPGAKWAAATVRNILMRNGLHNKSAWMDA